MNILAAIALMIFLFVAAICLISGEVTQGLVFLFISWLSSVGIRITETKGMIK